MLTEEWIRSIIAKDYPMTAKAENQFPVEIVIQVADAAYKKGQEDERERMLVWMHHNKPIYGIVDGIGECATVVVHIPIEDWQSLKESTGSQAE